MPIGLTAATVGLIGAGVGAAGAIGSAFISADAASDSAAAYERAAKRNNALQEKIYLDNKGTFAPYVGAGVAALDPLMASYGLKGQAAQDAAIASFHNAPDYAFTLNEGLKGVGASASARGGIYSGGALKALQRYGSDYADRYLGNWRQGLAGLVTTGVGGAQNTAQAGQGYANAYGANNNFAAGGQASAYKAGGDAWAGGLQDLSTIAAYGAGNGWFNAPNAGGSTMPPTGYNASKGYAPPADLWHS